ncbi:hypothetical protein [Ruegeria halocynthiae]|uniref:hypothetical protein n=1 Tax=Ruegeria halocynthiae TaxID=985054 RepID=UPI00115FA32A|nr:hypothetical protein [Ruegeria halocynthiae]
MVRPILERGYAIISPTALDINYVNGPGTGWVWDMSTYGRTDFDFVTQVIDDAAKRFPLDASRILVSGHSRGGSFAWYLACEGSDPRLTAFAPIGGTLERNNPGGCTTSDFEFNMFYSHGYSDTVIPFEGASSREVYPGYLGAVESAGGLAILSKCHSNEFIQTEKHDRRNWSECETGSKISLLGFEGGHGIPQGWMTLVLDWFEKLPAKN